MTRQRISLLIIFLALVVNLCGGSVTRPARTTTKNSTNSPAQFVVPADTTDTWLGGTGVWSNGVAWSGGLPDSTSDVYINSNYDLVTLDTEAFSNSLTIGGSSGSSTLQGIGSAPEVLWVTLGVVVNPTGHLNLNLNALEVGTDVVNMGAISAKNGSILDIAASLTNSAGFSAEAA